MPVLDTTSVLGGFGQQIVDWAFGDDRQFSGDVNASPNPPPTGDLALSDAYFTFKQNYLDTDANALIQVHITQLANPAGQITGANFTQLLFKIISGNYENLTNVLIGPTYYWDIRCITAAGGVTFTAATGTVVFRQNVTRTDKASTPATFPNQGNPQFRGYRFINPQLDSSFTTLANVGDVVFNQIPPANGTGPIGWQCIGQGIPGKWVAFGTTNFTGLVPATSWTWGTAPPVGGTAGVGDIVWNTAPTAGGGASGIIGWVCITAGSPGVWKEFGAIQL